MSDIAIAALSGAGVTIAVAISMLVLGLRASDAEQRCADARVDAANRKAQGVIDAAAIATFKDQLTAANKRADAIQDEWAKESGGVDPIGAHSRVLSRWAADRVPAEPAADSAAGAVPVAPAAAPSDDGKPNG